MPAHTRRNKNKQGYRLLLICFLTITLFALLLGSFVQIYQTWNNRIWKDQTQFTVVVTSKPVVILSYRSQTQELTIIPFPENTEIVGAFEVGRWKVENLYAMGKQRAVSDPPAKSSGKLLALSMQNAFGVATDGWIDDRAITWLGYANAPSVREEKHKRSIVPMVIVNSFEQKDTNLNIFDRIKLAFVLSTLSNPNKHIVLPEKAGLIERTKLVSGELGWVVVKDSSEVIRRKLVDTAIVAEGVGVGIVNATNMSGLGSRVTRILESIGVSVLWIKTEGNLDQRCVVYANTKGATTKTYARLVRLLNCSVNVDKDSSSMPSIEVVLGEKISSEFPGQ